MKNEKGKYSPSEVKFIVIFVAFSVVVSVDVFSVTVVVLATIVS